MKPLQKIIVIVGPTASGKTSLAIALAQAQNGEVISADSRQVYRGLDIGTGKVTPEEMNGVVHHLIDILDPMDVYTASDFRDDADKAINDIASRGKLPIIAGGTLFYVDTLLGNFSLARVAPNKVLREELERLSEEELFDRLLKQDPAFAGKIDAKNKRRLVRALEVVTEHGYVPALTKEARYDALIIGIDIPLDVLYQNIHKRLKHHLAQGMLKEAKTLHAQGLSFERMESLGLEYRYMARHLQGTLSEEELSTTLDTKIRQYAKRQRTWLKKMKDVQWVGVGEVEKAEEMVKKFLEG